MKRADFLVVLALAAGLGISPAALAAPAKKAAPAAKASDKKTDKKETGETFLIAKFGDWGAYVAGKDKNKVCYAMSQPKERLPKSLTRDPAYIFITERNGANTEVAFIMGFPLQAGTPASVSIGAANFNLLTKDKNAWVKSAPEETQLIDAIRKASAMTVKGTSLRGNVSTDRYSLTGAGQAIDRAGKECE